MIPPRFLFSFSVSVGLHLDKCLFGASTGLYAKIKAMQDDVIGNIIFMTLFTLDIS